MSRVSTLGLDADDTLWENEGLFQRTGETFRALLEPHARGADIGARLLEAEIRNLKHYGFGVKGFTLSMVETALDLTGDRVPGAVVREILDFGRSMLEHPVETLPGVPEALAALLGRVRLVLITKGDLFDQERKLAASGLGEFFDAVEIVSDKTPAVYARLFARHGAGAEGAMMAGNSLKSDVLPALEAGAFAAHVPHGLTWAYEQAEAPTDHPRFFALGSLAELPDVLDRL